MALAKNCLTAKKTSGTSSPYIIEDGAAKDLSFRLRHSIYRGSGIQNEEYAPDMNDTRLIIEYPLDII